GGNGFSNARGVRVHPRRTTSWLAARSPPSATQAVTLAIADGRASPLTDETRLQILGEWKAWDVKTVVVGPMAHEQEEVDFVTGILGRSPEQVDGVYVWWGVDLNSSS